MKWAAGLFFSLVTGLHSQTCDHQVTRSPYGPILVYQNGGLLQQNTGWKYQAAPAGTQPTISPVSYSVGDVFQATFDRAVSQTVTVSGTVLKYNIYQTWLETWACTSGVTIPPTDQLVHCESGLISGPSFSALPAAPNVETTIMQLPANWRYEQITLCETERFLGQSIVTASMGRPGPTNNYELSGAVAPLGASANNLNCWQARPIAPQFTGPYSIVVNLAAQTFDALTGVSTPGDITKLSSGVLTWEVCGYKALIGDPSVIGVPKVGALKVCSGSGPGWDCSGLYQVQVIRADGSLLPIIGPAGVAPPGSAVWSDVK
jgi:hypothetical protein